MIREALQRQNINEANTITLYHGDNFGTKRIEPRLMMNGNVQEGIGIYFSPDLSVAQGYGSDIVYAEVNPKLFVNSRGSVGRNLKLSYNLLKFLFKIDPEALWYMITDWGIVIENPEDVKLSHIRELNQLIKEDEVRNFLITLAQSFDVEDVAKAWMHVYPKKLGTYNKDINFYAIINTKVFLRKYNNPPSNP